jgi:TonB family protein
MRIKTFFLTSFLLFTLPLIWAQDEPDINIFIPVDFAPEPVNMREVKTAIGYPQAAIDSNISGVVVVRVLVDEAGKYVKHKVIKSPDEILSEAVENKIGNLTFSPAMVGEKAVKYWVNVPFHFKLTERSATDASYIKEAIDAYTKKIEENPDDHTLYLQRGVQHSNGDDFEKALDDLNKSISLNPKKNKKKNKDYFYLFFAQLHRGKVYNARGEWEQAKFNFNGALQTFNEAKVKDTLMEQVLSNIYLERGVAYSRLDMYQDALADYDKAIELDAENACLIHGFKYDLSLSEKDYPTVVSALDELIACEPSNPAYTLHYNRGYYKIRSGEYESALLDLDTVETLSNIIYLQLGAINQKAEAYRLMGNTEKALAETQRAMDINLLHPSAYFSRAKIYKDLGETEKACVDIEKAISYGLEGDDLIDLQNLQKEICE